MTPRAEAASPARGSSFQPSPSRSHTMATTARSSGSLGEATPGLPGRAAAPGNVDVGGQKFARDAGIEAPAIQPLQQKEHIGLPQPTTTTSASAAFSRSLLLFLGFMFRRPSKLFRPNRLDTWGGLRRLAESADQNLSPAFVRGILKLKGGALVLGATLLPPLIVNTTLGFLLFSSHSLISLWLARLPYFHRNIERDEYDPLYIHRDFLGHVDGDFGDPNQLGGGEEEEEITLETIIRGPRVIPKHPTLLSAIAGAGAGIIQGMAFTPIENVVRLIQQSASSITAGVARFLRLPGPKSAVINTALGPPPSSPLEALRSFLAHETWHKSQSWWTGWRWAIARDAVSYSIFFATFDVTRRIGIRVKSVASKAAGGPRDGSADDAEDDAAALRAAASAPPGKTPVRARVAQALTIVFGGIAAGALAEAAGRPFRAFQRLSARAASERVRLAEEGKPVPERYRRPLAYAWRTYGIRTFYHRDGSPLDDKLRDSLRSAPAGAGKILSRALQRAAWRVAAVGPWGLGFLVYSYIGGEV